MEQLVGLRPLLLFVWFIFVRFIFVFPSTIPCTESQTDQNFPCGHKLFSNVFMGENQSRLISNQYLKIKSKLINLP